MSSPNISQSQPQPIQGRGIPHSSPTAPPPARVMSRADGYHPSGPPGPAQPYQPRPSIPNSVPHGQAPTQPTGPPGRPQYRSAPPGSRPTGPPPGVSGVPSGASRPGPMGPPPGMGPPGTIRAPGGISRPTGPPPGLGQPMGTVPRGSPPPTQQRYAAPVQRPMAPHQPSQIRPAPPSNQSNSISPIPVASIPPTSATPASTSASSALSTPPPAPYQSQTGIQNQPQIPFPQPGVPSQTPMVNQSSTGIQPPFNPSTSTTPSFPPSVPQQQTAAPPNRTPANLPPSAVTQPQVANFPLNSISGTTPATSQVTPPPPGTNMAPAQASSKSILPPPPSQVSSTPALAQAAQMPPIPPAPFSAQSSYPGNLPPPPMTMTTPTAGSLAQQVNQQLSLNEHPPLVTSGAPPSFQNQPPPPPFQVSSQQRRVYPSPFPPAQTPGTVMSPPQPGMAGQQPSQLPPHPQASPTGPLQPPLVHSGPAQRIDPNQIPRPQPPSSVFTYATRVNGTANLPPPAGSQFVTRDTGNCSPRFMRCTLHQIPCTSDLVTTSGIPITVIVQPMALQDAMEEPIQVVDFGESGPVRCSRCKAYINPHMKFIDLGRRFVCNLCGFTNETPRDYMCNLGGDGRRRDADERPELCRGSVEFVAPKEYMVRDPMPQTFFFLIDVSSNAISSGATACVCNAVHKVLSDLQDNDKIFVGLATYDATIHFYSLNPLLQQSTMLVVPDVTDVYTPLPSDLVVPLPLARERILQLLDNIPSMFLSNRTTESALGAAIQGGYLAVKSNGGKLLVFQSAYVSTGLGSLAVREAEGKKFTVAGEKEIPKLLQPLDKTFKEMASDFADFQVSVDLFITSESYVDVASMSVISKCTGGQVYHYYPFNVVHDSAKLYNDIRWNINQPQALESIMKVRCSSGLTVQDYFGHFHRRIPSEIYLPNINSDHAIMVTFKHEDKIPDNTEACFQCALLYTTVSGERRVRVHTLSLPTSSILANLFRVADLDTIFTYLLKKAAMDVPTMSAMSVRESVVNQCVNILYAYRKYCASASSSGQLILPEALKLLPLYTLALNKSQGLQAECSLDLRSYWLSKALSIPASLSVVWVYPRMFSFHNLDYEDENENSEKQNIVNLPPVIPLTSEKLNSDGIFFLENGETGIFWIGKNVSPQILFNIFGFQSNEEIIPGHFTLQQFENRESKKVNEIINEIRRQRCSYLRLWISKSGHSSENHFLQMLIEDRVTAGMSYVEFLVYVHRQIQNKMG